MPRCLRPGDSLREFHDASQIKRHAVSLSSCTIGNTALVLASWSVWSCRCGSHGALLRGRQQTASRELSSCSESDTDASCEDTDGADDSVPFDDLDSSSSCEVSELRDTADSKLCRPYSRPKRKQRHLTQSTLLRCCRRQVGDLPCRQNMHCLTCSWDDAHHPILLDLT